MHRGRVQTVTGITGSSRSAARLAHQSGGLGVPSSNLGAPTRATLKALKSRIFLRTLISLETRQIHNSIHRRVLRMVTLRQDTRGNFSARKRLPDNVREEYGRRYGQRPEAKFFASASKGVSQAKQMFRDWETEVAGRIAAIRAERTGEGIALTPQQARALAGEWYDWFVARHPLRNLQTWDLIRDDLWDALRDAIGHEEWERGAQDELWRE